MNLHRHRRTPRPIPPCRSLAESFGEVPSPEAQPTPPQPLPLPPGPPERSVRIVPRRWLPRPSRTRRSLESRRTPKVDKCRSPSLARPMRPVHFSFGVRPILQVSGCRSQFLRFGRQDSLVLGLSKRVLTAQAVDTGSSNSRHLQVPPRETPILSRKTLLGMLAAFGDSPAAADPSLGPIHQRTNIDLSTLVSPLEVHQIDGLEGARGPRETLTSRRGVREGPITVGRGGSVLLLKILLLSRIHRLHPWSRATSRARRSRPGLTSRRRGARVPRRKRSPRGSPGPEG
jgi:hypothetical protein